MRLVGLGAFAGLAVGSCLGESPSERLGDASGAVVRGTEDPSGPDAKFPAVVWVRGTAGNCSGTLISDRVVLTAAHCFTNNPWTGGLSMGCIDYAYQQPLAPGGPALTNVSVALPPVGSADSEAPGADVYGADAVAWHPSYVGPLVDRCCGGIAAGCGFCEAPPNNPSGGGFGINNWSDVALVHLDRPVVGVTPMNVILRRGDLDEANHTYPVELTELVDAVVAVAGMSATTDHPDFSHRAWGVMRVEKTDYAAKLAAGTECTFAVPAEDNSHCDGCKLTVAAGSLAGVLEDGGACPVGGDSGGPVVINHPDPEVGTTSLSNLPPGPFVVGEDAAGGGACPNTHQSLYTTTWDTASSDIDPNDPARGNTNNGSFILSHLQDFDLDGIPDADDADDCPTTPNGTKAQEAGNCNQDAEDRWEYPRVGDACDPIPCPAAELGAPKEQIAVDIDSTYLKQRSGRMIRDTIFVAPVGSHAVGNGANPLHRVPQVAVPAVMTDYAFCKPEPTAGLDCGVAFIADTFAVASPGPFTAAHPYNQASMHFLSDKAPPGSFSQEPLDYPSSGHPRRWAYADDYAAWKTAGFLTATDSCDGAFGCGTNLSGRFWLHGETTKGTYLDQVGTGYRVMLDGVTADGRGLSNHYFYLEPDRRFSWSVAGKLTPKPPLFQWRFLPDPPPFDVPGWDGVAGQDTVLLPLRDGHLGLLRQDGEALVADGLVGPHLRALLADESLVWVSAAEPRLDVGGYGERLGFLALAFTGDGHDFFDGVLRGPWLLGSTADFSRPDTSRPGSPSPRKDFTAVFSRAEDAAFVLGGRDLATDELLHDVWMRRVEAPGQWQEVALRDYEPGRVLAATWSFLDRRLWVLDERNAPGGKRARLVRIDPYLGTAEPVADWKRGPHFDATWLVVDADGQVLLATSSGSKKKHGLVRFGVVPFDARAPIRVERLAVEDHPLAFAPLVDFAGYLFVVRRGQAFESHRVGELPGEGASLGDLGAIL